MVTTCVLKYYDLTRIVHNLVIHSNITVKILVGLALSFSAKPVTTPIQQQYNMTRFIRLI